MGVTDILDRCSDTELEAAAYQIRKQVLEMASNPTGNHLGGSLSAADILAVLYFAVLRLRPEEPEWPERDLFILSKGHASAALYGALSSRGFFPAGECRSYGIAGGRLAGHPLRRLPGVEFLTGSLGHGLSLGVGTALGARLDGRPNRTFVLLGDGELQEGSVWEAAMAASHFKLGNLVGIVDRNGWQISGRTEECMALEPLADKWRAFGWAVEEVDGHDVAALRRALSAARDPAGPPLALLAKTIKGSGIRFFEDRQKSHYVKLDERLYQRASAWLQAGRNGKGRP